MFSSLDYVKYRPNVEWSESVHWLATITLENYKLRDPLIDHMYANGVEVRQMVYPVHMALPYSKENESEQFPIANSVSLASLHLPSSLNITYDQQEHIVDIIASWLEDHY